MSDLIPVPGHDGAFVRPMVAAGRRMDVAADVRRQVAEGRDAEAATRMALAYHAGRREDGSPMWPSREAVESCDDFDLVMAVSDAAADTIPEARSGN